MTSSAGSVTLGLQFGNDALEASVRSGVAAVEDGLRDAVRSDDSITAPVAAHLLAAGGKRFRPLLAVLAAHFGDAGQPDVTRAAVVMELTHLATLYHDDVMDEAKVRRGAESANSRWSNSVAILTGDFLFSRASNLLAGLGPEAVLIQARTFERLVLGQIHETVGPAEGISEVDHYLSVLADKTGALIATSAEFGARFAGVDPATTDLLRRFGEQVGMAFQLSDDILDIEGDETYSGKTPGTDLREGVPTLPVLYALRSVDASTQHLRDLVSRPLSDDAEVSEALGLLRESAALDEARATLRGYADEARALLPGMPDVPARAALSALVDLVVLRSA